MSTDEIAHDFTLWLDGTIGLETLAIRLGAEEEELSAWLGLPALSYSADDLPELVRYWVDGIDQSAKASLVDGGYNCPDHDEYGAPGSFWTCPRCKAECE